MGVFWSEIKRSCAHVSMQQVPLLFPDVRTVCSRGESSLERLREAVRSSNLPPAGSGRISLLEDAMVLRPAVSLSVGFFGARGATEVAALWVSVVCVDAAREDVRISLCCQKNDQLGVGQMAHMVALPSRKGARPARLPSDWPDVSPGSQPVTRRIGCG